MITGRPQRLSPADWWLVGFSAVALTSSVIVALLINLLGPWYWERWPEPLGKLALLICGVAAPGWVALFAMWGILTRHGDWPAARRKFLLSLCPLPVVLLGYALLVGWIEVS